MGLEEDLIGALNERKVRFVAIGVWGVNLYARNLMESFATRDKDLFLPLDPENLVSAWQACDAVGLELFCGDEPLDQPRDLFIARAVVQRRALTRATDGNDVARLTHIAQSKAAAGRPKDRLFLESHKEVLESLIRRHEGTSS